MNSPPDTPTPDTPPAPTPDPHPKRFLRSSTDRIIGGVCGGLGRYFGVDPTLVRIGMVALALLGGTGLIVYAAALVLVPSDGEVAPGPNDTRDRAIAVGLAIALTIAGFALGGFGLAFGSGLVTIAALCVAGLAVWWLVSGERPSGSPGDVVRRAAIGAGILLGCFALAVGSFLASGFGGGVVVAALVIAASAALVASAFVGGARWLVLPAMAIALPLAFVSAIGLDLRGGFGERHFRPGTLAEVRNDYRLGAGELIVDLRDVKLPAGDRHVKIGIGAGHALVLVPDDVCVASDATVGIGAVGVFERNGGGIDVDWSDARRAPAGTPRLVVDGDVGLGLLEVRHHDDARNGPRHPLETNDSSERNAVCATRVAMKGSGASTG
jgi:phage shock protein PspC (stress-responsive transcriptional regulator)